MMLQSLSRKSLGALVRGESRCYRNISSLSSGPSNHQSDNYQIIKKQRQQEHSTSAAASALPDLDPYDEEDGPVLVTRTRPRLQELRSKLKKDPPAKAFLATNKHSKAKAAPKPAPKQVHWRDLLDRSQEAPPLMAPTTSPAPAPKEQPGVLTDRFGRNHTYLRISLAERCNLRCTYCMPPEGVPLQPESQLLQTPEILALAQHFRNHGVNKIRLTGGEPTLRKDLVGILKGLSDIGGFEELAITTNAVTLAKNLDQYVDAGLNRVNISLDTLHPDKFETLTRRPASYFDRVWKAIEATMAVSPDRLVTKINMVIMKGINDDEVADFCALQQQFPNLHVRFIEYMPFTDNGWDMDRWVPYRDLLQQLEQRDDLRLVKLPEKDPSDTTKWYTTQENSRRLNNNGDDTSINGHDSIGIGRIGFITSMSQPFCSTCNRLRLTSDGQIKVCLFDGNSTISLRDALREGAEKDDLDRLIQHALQKKHYSLGGHSSPEDILKDSDSNRPMTLIGG